MDFKQLISKIDSIEAPKTTPAAPKLPDPVQLNEDAQLRVLAGTSNILAEAKKMEEGFDDMKKDVADRASKEKKEKGTGKFDVKKTSTGTQYTRKSSTFDDGGKDKDLKKAEKKSKKDESIEPEFKSKFMKMVEAKKKEKDEAKSKKMEEAKKEKMSKKDKKMDEAAKPDFLDIDDDGNEKEPMKSAAASKGGDKKDGKKGMSDKQAKYFGKKNESTVKSKKVVAESVESAMSFKDMMKLVVESGGQQQIDPIDKALFAWATRVAETKLGEGLKSEVYAGMVYERMGGKFEMYDVLAETKK